MRFIAMSRQRLLRVLVMTCASVVCAQPAFAAIIDFSLNVSVIGAPASVGEGDMVSDDFVFVFAERQSHVLGADLRLNIDTPGMYGDVTPPWPELAAGTTVDSYFLHADAASRRRVYTGFITFDTDILGIITGGILLAESDPVLGALTTSYPDEFGRGLALAAGDFLQLSADRRTLSFSFETGSFVDQMRIVTEATPAVPEPGALALLGVGLLAAVCYRRRS